MWAVELLGGNTGEGYDMNTTWSGFDVCVTLTDEGLKHWEEVGYTLLLHFFNSVYSLPLSDFVP